MTAIGKTIGLGMVRGYQRLSFWMPASCRYTPTCSQYTYAAIEKYGLLAAAGWAPSASPDASPSILAATTRSDDEKDHSHNVDCR